MTMTMMMMARPHIQVVFYLTGNKLIIIKQIMRIDENQILWGYDQFHNCPEMWQKADKNDKRNWQKLLKT